MFGRTPLAFLWISAATLACSGAPAEIAGRTSAAARPRASAASAAVAAPVVSSEVSSAAVEGASEEGPAAGGEGAEAAVARPRLTSRGYTSFIWRRPRVEKLFIGYVRHGQSVALKSTETVAGINCPGGFYAIEPRGYICNDRTVTLAPAERFVAAARATDPGPGPLPYHYALSNGSPMYNRVPTRDEQMRFERVYGPVGKWRALDKALAAHGDLAFPDTIAAKDLAPGFFLDGKPADSDRMGLIRQTIPLGSMVSFTRAFAAEGRTWLLSVDQTLVPADRVKPFRPSAFHGTRLGGAVKLPLAWMRKNEKPHYQRLANGAFEKTGASWAVRTWVGLSGAKVAVGRTTYLETSESDGAGGHLFVAEGDATVAEAREKLPFGVELDRKWIHVSISKGLLIAYQGLTPWYVTLISPGKGGLPQIGKSSLDAATTPTGTYNVTFKDRAATMSPETGENRSFWIQDVPWTQYFDAPFALHAAFWHERFGEPTSAGCVNMAPIDAEWLFGWSDPPVPEGWQGATGAGATKENGPTTAVVVQR